VAEGWCKDTTLEMSHKVVARALQRGLTLPDTTRAMVERVRGGSLVKA
jgi:hypothetical protein